MPKPSHHISPTPWPGGDSATAASADSHWVVRMNHTNRTWSWVVLGVLVGLHLQPAAPPAWVWLALGLQFVVYPHLLFWIPNFAFMAIGVVLLRRAEKPA